MNNKLILSLTSILLTNIASAATRVDLKHQSANYIKPYFALNSSAAPTPYELQKTSTDIDFNQTTHVRLQQLYSGVPVWSATPVLHLPKANNRLGLCANLNKKTTMNGVVYEGLDQDLASTPTYALTDTQKQKAMQDAKQEFEKKVGTPGLSYTEESVKTIIYIDNNKAHYAFLVSFYYDDGATGAHRPTAIVDAESLHTYHAWDGVVADNPYEVDDVMMGGIGGNEKTGEVIYDGAEGHLPAVKAKHIGLEGSQGGINYKLNYCMLLNDEVTIFDMSYGGVNPSMCAQDATNKPLFWLSIDNNATRWKADEMNGGYSPSLDAFYNANIVNHFFQEWYGVPALVQEDGKTPMMLTMRVHYGRNFDNAFWDGKQMTFGDGGAMCYPLTSLGVTAHEISHGFTAQHSAISLFEPQMGALHEAFSDEAAVAMQYYATGKTTWDIGRDIMKNEGAMRYLDNPKKDGRSIDHMKDFDATEPHGAAGIFNKAFYLMATTKGWDIRKAFNVMVKANMNYWTADMTTFSDAACGVISATRDYGYSTTDVRMAFVKVGIDTDGCGVMLRSGV